MLYGIKLNEEEVFMAKKGSVFTFYVVKKFDKIFKWKSVSKEGRSREDMLADKLNSKKFKSQLVMVLSFHLCCMLTIGWI